MKQCNRIFYGLFCGVFLLLALIILRKNGYFYALLCLALAWYWLGRHPIRHFTFWLFVISLGIHLFWVTVLRPPVVSDFSLLLDASQSLLTGDTSFTGTTYFTLWAYQLPFVLWQSFWLWIWNNIFILKLINCLLAAGISCLLYRLVLPHVRPAAAQTATLLLNVFPFFATFSTILSNQIPSAFFLILGAWLLLSTDTARLRFWRYPLAGIALQLGNLLRPEGILLLAAILACCLFTLLRSPHRWKELLLGLLVLFVVYAAVAWAADYSVRTSGLNDNGIQNELPGWKFVCGLNHETGGAYSSEDWQMLEGTLDEHGMPTAQTAQIQRELISERLTVSPDVLLQLILSKADALWNTSGLYWAFGHLFENDPGFWIREIYDIICNTDQGLFALSLLLAVLGLRKITSRDPEAHISYWVFLAAFFAFLLIEVQSRYAYLPQLFLFAAASFGVEQIYVLSSQHRSLSKWLSVG